VTASPTASPSDQSPGQTSPGSASDVEQELATQPAAWRAVVDALDTYRRALPERDARVAMVGCGTSLYMSRAVAELREAAGHGETDAFAASEYRYARTYDHVVAITRSGTTTEVLETLERLGPSVATTVLTVDPTTRAGELARHVIDLPMAAERSVVQTVFPTTVLALFRAAFGEDLDGVIAAGARAVSDPLPLDPADVQQVTFLGRGWAAAIAEEAALKCREAAGFWTEAYPAMEYRHGPISVSGPGKAVWLFGDEPENVARDASSTGATYVHSPDDPMADLIRAQRLAVGLARRVGRDPDRPQALSFSVVLEPEPS
jgi:CRISPR-associated protein Cas5a/b/c